MFICSVDAVNLFYFIVPIVCCVKLYFIILVTYYFVQVVGSKKCPTADQLQAVDNLIDNMDLEKVLRPF